MQDDVKELCERLRQLELRISAGANEACGEAAATIARLSAENEALRDALILCKQIVERNLGRQDEKIADIPLIVDRALKALEGTQHD